MRDKSGIAICRSLPAPRGWPLDSLNPDTHCMADQSVFQECYRGRHSVLHHAAYMRMAKVLLIQQMLEQAHVGLEGKSVFDYGFGAGTLFRYLPTNSQIYGVEMDQHNVDEVRSMLRERGHRSVDLEPIEIATWESHRLLGAQYDLVVCSHVLEHLPDPAYFLGRLRQCLRPGGFFLGLVPINELKENPFHEWQVTEAMIRQWAAQSGMSVTHYLESDHIGYYFQPVFCYTSGLGHKLSRVVSFVLGVPSTVLGFKTWWTVSRLLGKLTGCKPTQAAFLLQATSP
jgi:2-polyprenyl-3-methyl-5-hydroxy-6-metoxy-1,4-benzoquinol methylase